MSVSLLAATLTFGALVAQVVSAGDLYPKCAGTVHSTIAPWLNDQEYEVLKLDNSAESVSVDCLAFRVTSLTPLGHGCSQETIDSTLPFDLYLKAVGPQNYSWRVENTVGGSVEKLLYAVPRVSKWEFAFVNRHPYKCPLKVEIIATTQYISDTDVEKPSPVLTVISPTTVFQGKNTLLAFKVIENPSPQDEVRVKPLYGSDSAPWVTLSRVTKMSTLAEFQITGAEFAAFEHDFPSAGNYQVDYKRGDVPNATFVSIAHIIVYGGDPAFFRVTAGGGPDGQIWTNREITITFFGANLNTKKDVGDQAKFVEKTQYACNEDAPPAGDVPLNTDLGPGDSDVNVTRSDFTFTLRHTGMYRVCYKRAGGSWMEVVSRDDLPDLGPTTMAPADVVPTPTDPETKLACSLAPPRSNPPNYATYVVLTLNTDVFSYRFRTELAKKLCIAPDTIAILDITHLQMPSGQRRLQLYIDIVCDSYGRTDRCSGVERKYYISFLWGLNPRPLTLLGVTDVQEVRADGIFGDQSKQPVTQPSSSPHIVVVFLICVTVLGIIAMCIYGIVRHQKGHRFIQVTNPEEGTEATTRSPERDNNPPPAPGRASSTNGLKYEP